MTPRIRIPGKVLVTLASAAVGLDLASGCAPPRTRATSPPVAPVVERVTRLQAPGLRVEVRIPGASTMRIGEREPVILRRPPPPAMETFLAATATTGGIDPSISALSGDLMAVWAALGILGSALADEVESESRAGGRGEAAKIAEAWMESGTLHLTGTRADGQKASFDVRLDAAAAERLRVSLDASKR